MPSERKALQMDWDLVIRKNREALVGIIAALFTLTGISPAQSSARLTLTRPVRRQLLLLLRPAEAATRRLIVIAAHRLKQSAPRPQAPVPDFSKFQKGGSTHLPTFRLVDPRKRFFSNPSRSIAKTAPRISVPGITPVAFQSPVTQAHSEDGINATQLAKRLVALKIALDDLPRQARRLVRYQASMRQELGDRTPVRVKLPPLRPGRPPGHQKRKKRLIDDILFECHLLARDVENWAPV